MGDKGSGESISGSAMVATLWLRARAGGAVLLVGLVGTETVANGAVVERCIPTFALDAVTIALAHGVADGALPLDVAS